MSPTATGTAGLLRDLGALETRHREVPFEEIRTLLDRDRTRGWRLFVEKYSKFVWSLSLQLAQGLSDPEEFAAEIYRRVFVRLEASDFRLLRQFEGRCRFRTYLYRVVRTERFRLFRRRGTERDARDRLEHEAAASVAADVERAAARTEALWSAGIGRQAAGAALGELDPEDREILTLRFAAGLKLRELAGAIGARDTNDAAYRVRRALGRCQALTRARASDGWNEEAFREAAREFRRALFPEDSVQNPEVEVSDAGGTSQEEMP